MLLAKLTVRRENTDLQTGQCVYIPNTKYPGGGKADNVLIALVNDHVDNCKQMTDEFTCICVYMLGCECLLLCVWVYRYRYMFSFVYVFVNDMVMCLEIEIIKTNNM